MRSPTFKLMCYLLVTLLTALASELEPLTAQAVAGWTALEWTKMGISVLIPTALVWRAFVDQSISNPISPQGTTATVTETHQPRPQTPTPCPSTNTTAPTDA